MFELFMFWVWVTVLAYLALATPIVFSLFGLRILLLSQLKKTNLSADTAKSIGDSIYKLCDKVAFGALWDKEMLSIRYRSLSDRWIPITVVGLSLNALIIIGSTRLGISFGAGAVQLVSEAATFLAAYTSWAAPLVLIVMTARVVFVRVVNFWIKISSGLDKINKAND